MKKLLVILYVCFFPVTVFAFGNLTLVGGGGATAASGETPVMHLKLEQVYATDKVYDEISESNIGAGADGGTFTTGCTDNGYKLDGDNEGIEITEAEQNTLGVLIEKGTITFESKPTSDLAGSAKYIVHAINGGDYIYLYYSWGDYYFIVQEGYTVALQIKWSHTQTAGTCKTIHVAWDISDGSWDVYIDGVDNNSNVTEMTQNNESDDVDVNSVYIGARSGIDQYYPGTIDEFKWYDTYFTP